MEAKSVFHAAVGAPVVAYQKVGDKVSSIKGKVDEQTTSYTKTAEKAIEGWAVEGEKVITRISEGKVVEEISSKVDLDQAKEQVTKLRDQLEDMLATWRTSFRPEKGEEAPAAEEVVKAEDKADKKPAAKKPATKAPAAKASAPKASATKTAKSSTDAKTSSAKSTSEKKAS